MASVASNASQMNRLVSCAQSSVADVTASRIRTPPIVGVPAFLRWLCGPSSRTTCRARIADSLSMILGPRSKVTSSAVRNAPAVRNVTYRKTFRGPMNLASGTSR